MVAVPRGRVRSVLLEAVVVSVDGLLDAHEVAVRAKVEGLREEAARVAGALGEAELALEHVAITRATLAAVVAGHGASAESVQGVDAPVREGVGGLGDPAVVPPRRPDLTEAHLPVDYRRVYSAVRETPGGVRAKQLAVAFGLEPVPAKVEGVRSRLKRLVMRGWLAESAPGVFTVLIEDPPS
jgi:hypothetical protein